MRTRSGEIAALKLKKMRTIDLSELLNPVPREVHAVGSITCTEKRFDDLNENPHRPPILLHWSPPADSPPKLVVVAPPSEQALFSDSQFVVPQPDVLSKIHSEYLGKIFSEVGVR